MCRSALHVTILGRVLSTCVCAHVQAVGAAVWMQDATAAALQINCSMLVASAEQADRRLMQEDVHNSSVPPMSSMAANMSGVNHSFASSSLATSISSCWRVPDNVSRSARVSELVLAGNGSAILDVPPAQISLMQIMQQKSGNGNPEVKTSGTLPIRAGYALNFTVHLLNGQGQPYTSGEFAVAGCMHAASHVHTSWPIGTCKCQR